MKFGENVDHHKLVSHEKFNGKTFIYLPYFSKVDPLIQNQQLYEIHRNIGILKQIPSSLQISHSVNNIKLKNC